MTSKQRARGWRASAAASVLALLLAATASGQHARGHSGAPPRGGARVTGAPHQHFDGRFSNNHYYYDHGYSVHRPPRGAIGGLRGPHGGRYWYHRGNWYRRHGGSWVVWGAPVGVFVPWLPPYFTTIWWYGVPYYYANDTYYIWDDSRDQYQVVAPPAGIERRATTQAPPSDRLFVYPKNGQSPAQQSQDQYECHRWAKAQSGYDPTLAGSGVADAQIEQKRDGYFRADVACLEGRGYTVR